MLSCHPPDGQWHDEPLFAAILAARGWRVSRDKRPWPSRAGTRPRARAIVATARCASRYRESDGCVAASAAPSGRRMPSGPALLPVGPSVVLQARNGSVRVVGVLALLGQDRGMVVAVDGDRGRLEPECGDVREAEPW